MRSWATLAGMALAISGATDALAAWREATSAHFRIYANNRDPSVIRAFADRMERFDAAMRRLRNVPRTDTELNKLTIYVVPSVGAVRKLYGGGTASDVAGFYRRHRTGSIAFVPETTGAEASSPFGLKPYVILQHEYAHHFFFRTYPGAYPAWFTEGYAEFHSNADIAKDGAVLIGMPNGSRAFDLAHTAVPLSRLLAMGSYPPALSDMYALYAKGWQLVHYLTFSQARAGQLGAYLKEIAGGAPPIDAARHAFGDLNRLDRELGRYGEQHTISTYRIPPEVLSVGAITVRDLSPGAAAMMDVHLRSTRGVDDRTAQDVYGAARKAAAPYPNDPEAQAWLAEAATDAQAYDAAEAAEARALAADPHSQYALFYRAETAAEKAMHGKDHGAPAWNAVRHFAAAANHNDPNDPAPLVLFYRSFAEQRQRPSALAIAGLRRAYDLAPEAMDLRWLLAREDVAAGKFASARAMLAPIAYDPHGGPDAAAAATIIGKIDAGVHENLFDAADKADAS